MTVRSQDGRIILEGRCRVEDAEALLTELLHRPDSVVQLDMAETLHSAVIQVLLAARPSIEGVSKHIFLAEYGVLKDGQNGLGSYGTYREPL
jgi:hypothetical protein